MGLFDKIKASVGIGQPKVEVKMSNTTIHSDQPISGVIEITAQKTQAIIDEVKLEFILKTKAMRIVTKDGVESEEEFTNEGALYRILFKNNYSKHFEKFHYNGEIISTDQEFGTLDNNIEKNKIIVEPHMVHRIPFQFHIHIMNNYASSSPPEHVYFIRATIDMPGLDPKNEIEVNFINAQ